MANAKMQDVVRQSGHSWSNFVSGLIWMIAGYSIIIASQMVASIIIEFAKIRHQTTNQDTPYTADIVMDGDTLSLAFLLSLTIVTPTLYAVIRFRRSRSIIEYLAIRPVPISNLTKWLLIALVLFGVNHVADKLLSRHNISEWAAIAFSSADWKLAFFLSTTIAAPIVEEVLYRGYVVRAWLDAQLNEKALIVLMSIIWSLTHLQYDLYDMTWIFGLGLLLTYSRIRSRSLLPPIAIHIFWNVGAYMNVQFHLAS